MMVTDLDVLGVPIEHEAKRRRGYARPSTSPTHALLRMSNAELELFGRRLGFRSVPEAAGPMGRQRLYRLLAGSLALAERTFGGAR